MNKGTGDTRITHGTVGEQNGKGFGSGTGPYMSSKVKKEIKYGEPCPKCGLALSHGSVRCNYPYPTKKHTPYFNQLKQIWYQVGYRAGVKKVLKELAIILEVDYKDFAKKWVKYNRQTGLEGQTLHTFKMAKDGKFRDENGKLSPRPKFGGGGQTGLKDKVL
jgi:hypothetical protein